MPFVSPMGEFGFCLQTEKRIKMQGAALLLTKTFLFINHKTPPVKNNQPWAPLLCIAVWMYFCCL